MNKKYIVNLTVLAFFFLALGLEAMAGCACGQRGRHYHGYNQAVVNRNQCRVPPRPTFNSQVGVPIRWVQPVVVNNGYGYGYNPYGYANYNNYGYANGRYNGYGYNTYVRYNNRGNCRPRGGYYYRR